MYALLVLSSIMKFNLREMTSQSENTGNVFSNIRMLYPDPAMASKIVSILHVLHRTDVCNVSAQFDWKTRQNTN